MTRQISCAALLALLVVASGACTTKHGTAITEADRTQKDEAAIRQLLASLEKQINAGDIGFVDVFAKDAAIIVPSAPDITGYDAIRATYAGILKQDSMTVHFSTEEIAVAGDLAYEHGTYTLRIVDKKTGKVLQDVKNKHVHILKRQSEGGWKTWRMMVSSAEPMPAEKVQQDSR